MTAATAMGVACGIGAAALQSVAYVAARHYTQVRGRGSAAGLLVLMHLWMGAMAMVTLPLVWVPGVPWGRVAAPLVLTVVFNVLGQMGQTLALRHAEPSRVSPLMTVKVFAPAVLTLFYGPPVGHSTYAFLSGWQWLAVTLCVLASVSIARGGGGLRAKAAGALAFTVIVFSASDWFVGLTVGALLTAPGMTPLRASLLAASGLYLGSMLVALCVWPTGLGGRAAGRRGYAWADWRDSLPYAATWYAAMVTLFVAFAQVGLVLGSILQCTRSFLTILLGMALMYLGAAHIEPRQPHRVVIVRVAAGVLMFLAISLYLVRDPVALFHGR